MSAFDQYGMTLAVSIFLLGGVGLAAFDSGHFLVFMVLGLGGAAFIVSHPT